jgi:myosin heavy subunit
VLVVASEQVGTLQEEGEKEFSRQKQVLEAEVKELREKVRQDDEEIQELTGELRSTRRKAQLFEERALVLEESTDAETRSRLDAEQTLDLLKLEVDKLRALVQRQQEEIQRKAKEQQQLFDAELAQVKEELKETQELLLKERNERVLDKQKALDQRLERSAVAGEEKLDKLHALLVEQQQDLQRKAQEQEELLQLKTRQQEDGRRTAKEQQERHDAEVAELKRQLQAAEQLLQQERQRIVERPRVAAVSTERSTEEASEQQDAVRPTQAAARTSAQRAERFATDMQGDLAMFEEVKDLYAEDLFASRRWGAVSTRPSSHDSSLDAAAWQFASTSESSRPPNSGVGPALSEQELSVQEAVDRDMEALLRSETLDTLH